MSVTCTGTLLVLAVGLCDLMAVVVILDQSASMSEPTERAANPLQIMTAPEGASDCSQLSANERRPAHVELDTGHRHRALPCLGPIRYMAQGAVTHVDRTLERASARRFRIDPRTARDRERLRLRGYGHEGYAS